MVSVSTLLDLMSPERLEKFADDTELNKCLVRSTGHSSDVEAVRRWIREHNWVLEVALDGQSPKQVSPTGELTLVAAPPHIRKFSEVKVEGKTHYFGWFAKYQRGQVVLFIGLTQKSVNFEPDTFKGLGYLMAFTQTVKTCGVGNIQFRTTQGFGMCQSWARDHGKQDVLQTYTEGTRYGNLTQECLDTRGFTIEEGGQLQDFSPHFKVHRDDKIISQLFLRSLNGGPKFHTCAYIRETGIFMNVSCNPGKGIYLCSPCGNVQTNWQMFQSRCKNCKEIWQKDEKWQSEDETSVCNYCATPESQIVKHRRCSQCMSALYCSVECQKLDWKKAHREVCKKSTLKIDRN